MNNHYYQAHNLYYEKRAIKDIAEEIATPFYCYSQAAIIEAYESYVSALTNLDAQICYALKANSNQSIIKLLADQGSGADVVSEGELRRALAAGIPASKIVYSGVAKTRSEMLFALSQNIFQFNVESENELHVLNEVACSVSKQAAIAFRINPDVDANTHAKISTGMSENKFGIPISKATEIYKLADSMQGIKVQGIDVHIGSQLTQLTPFDQTFRLIREKVEELAGHGIIIKVIDVGGGLGVDYDSSCLTTPTKTEYCALLEKHFADINCKLLLEPGRSIVGNSGLLISRVIYLKQGEERTFAIIDAGMNDLLRPSMYDAYHEIIPLYKNDSSTEEIETHNYDVVGPICETGDTFARGRCMAPLNEGDLVALVSCGAYSAAMSSTYNSRLQVPEILVSGDQYSLIRKRTSYEELIKQDQLAPWLQ